MIRRAVHGPPGVQLPARAQLPRGVQLSVSGAFWVGLFSGLRGVGLGGCRLCTSGLGGRGFCRRGFCGRRLLRPGLLPPAASAAGASAAGASAAGASATGASATGTGSSAAGAASVEAAAALGTSGIGGTGRPLVAEGGQAVGKVAGHRSQQAGQALHRSGQRTGQTGQQDLARRKVGQGRSGLRTQYGVAQEPALDDEKRVGAGKLSQRLRYRGCVALDEGESGRTGHKVDEPVGALLGGQPHQGVLVDPVLGAEGSDATPERRQVLYLEPAVLGDDDGVGLVHASPHLIDDGHLVGPRVVHLHSFWWSALTREHDEHT